VNGKPDAEEYAFKVTGLGYLEALSEQERIDLFYGDESAVSLLPCIPYGWQFKGEQAFMPSSRGKGVNCFGVTIQALHSILLQGKVLSSMTEAEARALYRQGIVRERKRLFPFSSICPVACGALKNRSPKTQAIRPCLRVAMV